MVVEGNNRNVVVVVVVEEGKNVVVFVYSFTIHQAVLKKSVKLFNSFSFPRDRKEKTIL